MTREVYPQFIYGFEVTADNNALDFKEGSGSILTATLSVGSYTATEFASMVKAALDAAGDLVYTVTYNRSTRRMTIAASGAFSLIRATGPNLGNPIWDLMGYGQGADLTGGTTYTGTTQAGDSYTAQFWAQEYVSSDELENLAEPAINKTATGRVEVVSYGRENFIELNLMLITDEPTDGTLVRNNPTGRADAIRFLRYAITKAPFEYIEDDTDPDTFETVILESTADSQKGTGYRLRELYDRVGVGYYETGKLRLRVVE